MIKEVVEDIGEIIGQLNDILSLTTDELNKMKTHVAITFELIRDKDIFIQLYFVHFHM